MKRLILIALVVVVGGFTSKTMAQKENKVVCFKSNLDCEHCEKTVYEYLKFEKGVKDLKVDLASNTIFIEYKEGKNTEEGFAQAIEKKGYKAEKITEVQYKEIVSQAAESGHEHTAGEHKEN